jgi:hypothetical protein
MRQIALLISVLSVAASQGIAATRTVTILDGQKISVAWNGDQPDLVKDGDVRIITAGVGVRGGKLFHEFAFLYSQAAKISKVLVEDVTGNMPVVMVEVASPVLEEKRWYAETKPLALKKDLLPWVFQRGDTTKVYRFTISLENESKPMVIYQAAIFSAGAKSMFVSAARATGG